MDLYALPDGVREHYSRALSAVWGAYRLYRIKEPLMVTRFDPWIDHLSDRATVFDLPRHFTTYLWSDTVGVLFVHRAGVSFMYREDGRVAGCELFEPGRELDPLATVVLGTPCPMPEWN